jgi:peptidyl-prolyl cis-trans isomerase A (cyclophilin A)
MRLHLLTPLVAALLATAPTAAHAQDDGMVRVVMTTSFGDITVDVDTERAPGTAANFLSYVDEGFYDGGQFHRTVTMDNQPDNDVRIEVIQGSVNPDHADHGFGSIPLERTTATGLAHVDGAVSMARGAPDSASSSFFFCIGDQPSLDFGGDRNPDGQGFAAFGRVVAGMDVVRRIQQQPADGQSLDPPVGITSVSRAGR